MQNFESHEEANFFEKLMADGQKVRKKTEEECKNCSYGICDECQRKDEIK